MSPYFIVIAGPNGAGKSTTSKAILEPFNIEAFDWDKEFYKIWSVFEFDPFALEGVREATNSKFQSHIDGAFDNEISVAYETNFHSYYNIDLVRKAKKLKYRTVLYFLALSSPEIAISRVKERILKGGHAVSESTIRERFTKGLEILDQNTVQVYDEIAVYNSSERFELQFIIENQKTLLKKAQDPKIIKLLPNLSALLDA